MKNENIKILIVDNKEENILILNELLVEEYGFREECVFPKVSEQTSFREELRILLSEGRRTDFFKYLDKYILENDIDLLILDFGLTKDEENESEKISNTSGYLYLDHLNSHEKKELKELPIIIFSIFDSNLMTGQNLARPIAKIPKQLIDRNSMLQTLQSDLRKNNKSLFYSIIHHASIYKSKKESHYDLAILCALKEEFDEVLNLPNEWKGKNTKDVDDNGWKKIKKNDELYFETVFLSSKGKPIKVIGKCMNDMGMVESATYTTKMIHLFKPKYITMTGIAAGIKDNDIEVGDIIIPQFNWNWQAGKFKTTYRDEFDNENNKFRNKISTFFDKDMRQKELSSTLYDIVTQELEPNKVFYEDLFKNFCSEYRSYSIPILRENSKRSRYPKIITEKMLSGSAVVADINLINEIKQRKVVGLDMEAYGVFYAAKKSKTEPIIIKSICDFADEAKDDEYHIFASYASARTMYKLFTEYLF
ncbi:hypothetical protein [Aliarcobacter butzleri]|uniref:phosphorylase family protein n=1 Tax=Aliarcobacter butzleri TaxID=28197 RepID=UPI003BB1EAF8